MGDGTMTAFSCTLSSNSARVWNPSFDDAWGHFQGNLEESVQPLNASSKEE